MSQGFVKIDAISNSSHAIAEGRLTLTTAVPVTTSDVTGATTIYFTPYNGNKIGLYNGTNWKIYEFTEISLALGTLTSGKNYDVFIYDNAGVLTLEFSAAWTSDTARADALTTQNGVQVKSGATTRRYLGTFRTTSTTATEDSTSKRFVWNLYNQEKRFMKNPDETTDSWTYTTITYRQANANTANQFEYVQGISNCPLYATVIGAASNSSGALYINVGVGIDSTSVQSATNRYGIASTAGVGLAYASYQGFPGIGYHFIVWLERVENTLAGTLWVGDNAARSQAGIWGYIYG